jgi:hypothetical protein
MGFGGFARLPTRPVHFQFYSAMQDRFVFTPHARLHDLRGGSGRRLGPPHGNRRIPMFDAPDAFCALVERYMTAMAVTETTS